MWRLLALIVTDLMAAGPGLSSTLLDDTDPSPLFKPVDVVGLHLRNRLVMAPMTRQFSPGGVPGDDVVAYYRRRAPSLGLLITEGTYVDHPSAGASDPVPRFYGANALAAWRKVAGAVHAEGAAIFPQLWHLGAQRKPGTPPFPGAPVVSPSGVDTAGRTVGETASAQTLADIAASFARAAADTRAAGFDGVELHGAHTAISSTSSTGPPPTAATMTTAATSAAASGSAPRSRRPSGRPSARTSRSRSASRSGRAATTTPGSPRPRTSWRRSCPRW